MRLFPGWPHWYPVLAALLLSLAVATALDRTAPWPSADVARGSEDAFVRGLHPREIPPGGGPQRWTTERALLFLRDIPPGPATLEVRLHGHRGLVAVVADGVVLGVMGPEQRVVRLSLPDLGHSSHEVELRAEPFVAGDGRRLGALLDSVTLEHAPAGAPSARLLLSFALPASATALAASAAGLGGGSATVLAAALAALQALLLRPCGLLRSPYSGTLPWLLGAGALTAAAFARWMERRQAGSSPWAFACLMSAVLVQGVLATSPSMVVSDAVFHAHKLADVAGGDLFPTSITQHGRPFRFPYGVSFYALLAPLYRAGLDGVTLVRTGAAVVSVAASAGLFALLAPSGARLAGLTVVLLQLLPGTFDVFSHGNLSNVFGQSMTTLFFAWWAWGRAEKWPAGAALLALGCLGHFSSLVVLIVLCGALAFARRGRIVRERERDHARVLALAVGLGLSLAYYSHFAGLLLEQLPRLLEGGGQGRGASRTAWDALRLQVLGAASQWGIPAILLGLLGRPRPSRGGLDADLTAFWAAGALLAAAAAVSPLDVRYLYALNLPLAAAAGVGCLRLWDKGGAWRLLAGALLAAEAALGLRNIGEALLQRYR